MTQRLFSTTQYSLTTHLLEAIMAAKTFEGNVSIILNTKGEVALKKDSGGKFTAADATEIYRLMKEFSNKKNPINKYALFVVDGGKDPVLLVNRYGNPYIALLAPRGDGGGSKKTVTKLA
jgi:hypothetical protein